LLSRLFPVRRFIRQLPLLLLSIALHLRDIGKQSVELLKKTKKLQK